MVCLASTAQPLLLDTNVLIYHLKNNLGSELTEQLALAIEARQAYISVITRIEALGWKDYNDTTLL